MKNYVLMVAVGLVSLGLGACGMEEDWSSEESTELGAVDTEAELGELESALAAPDRVKYECVCDLSVNSCRGDYPHPLEKRSTCRYKRSRNACVGKCIGRCANARGKIKRGSEFKGKCKKRLITSGTAPAGPEEVCGDDEDEDEVDGEEGLRR